ncbi:hypothetical protein L6R49_25410 [Myxococcota bacterium]|nr:hypothetical protein [Myxococcota bacterium]
MLLILLFLGCNRATCDSSTLSDLADANCAYWAACPEFAPFIMESYETHEDCVEAMTRRERDVCLGVTEAPCNGKLSPARVVDCVEATQRAMETCDWVSGCVYVDTGISSDAMYQEVDSACKSETE